MSNNPPAYYKNNALTRAIERVQEINAQHGMRAFGGGIPQDSPVPRLTPIENVDPRNAPIGADDKPIPVVSNLSPEEQERREREWAAVSGQKIGAAKEDDDDVEGNYGTLAEATPVVRRPNRPLPSYNPVSVPIVYTRPAIMDFTKLQAVNFEDGTVVIDGVGFKLNATWLSDVRDFAVQGVIESIKDGLRSLPKSEAPIAATTEDVQPVPNAETPDGVPSAQSEN